MSSADAVAKLADLVKAAELFEAAGRTHIPVPIADIRRIHEVVKVVIDDRLACCDKRDNMSPD